MLGSGTETDLTRAANSELSKSPRRRIPDPFKLGKRPAYCKLFSPTSIGTLTAATLASYPSVTGQSAGILEYLPESVTSNVPAPVLLALLGFPVGYLATKTSNWFRWKAIQRLLAYQGWVHGGKGLKDKAWALLLTFLKGPGPFELYDFQRSLPKLPLPSLDVTLDQWLHVAATIVSKEEFEQTKAAVEMFRHNEGPKLQEYLEKKYQTEVNWLSDYWINVAYLASRDPICITSNYFLLSKTPSDNVDMFDRAASGMRLSMEFHEMIESNKLPPAQLMNLVPICMNGFRYIFNAIREPGEHIDRLQRYPGEEHAVIMRNGHYYKMDLYTHDGPTKRLLRVHEIRMQLKRIADHADTLPTELPVASLTSQNRTTWAKQRQQLLRKNSDIMKSIESSLFMVNLEVEPTSGKNDHCQQSLTGRGGDRWYDKPYFLFFFTSGAFGANVEHSGVDATVIMLLTEYMMMNERYTETNMLPGPEPDKSIPHPTFMSWDIEDMKSEINDANDKFINKANNVVANLMSPIYSKGVMKKARLSPDGYTQMAFQLAYYRLHKKTPKTYEPSTARLYALGRTENVYPVSLHSKAWVQAMLDPQSTKQTKKELLKKAVSVQNENRLQATVGQGCERHLVGLYCASREFGMDVPALYLDKAWQQPFLLSTSQTPCRASDLGSMLDLEWVVGGFGPQCADGYGLSYVFHSDTLMNICVTSYRSSEEANATKFSAAINQAMMDMKLLFE